MIPGAKWQSYILGIEESLRTDFGRLQDPRPNTDITVEVILGNFTAESAKIDGAVVHVADYRYRFVHKIEHRSRASANDGSKSFEYEVVHDDQAGPDTRENKSLYRFLKSEGIDVDHDVQFWRGSVRVIKRWTGYPTLVVEAGRADAKVLIPFFKNYFKHYPSQASLVYLDALILSILTNTHCSS